MVTDIGWAVGAGTEPIDLTAAYPMQSTIEVLKMLASLATCAVALAGPWLIDNAYPLYSPGACVVKDSGSEAVLVQYWSKKDGLRCRLGRLAK
jgi:hypothetical protein